MRRDFFTQFPHFLISLYLSYMKSKIHVTKNRKLGKYQKKTYAFIKRLKNKLLLLLLLRVFPWKCLKILSHHLIHMYICWQWHFKMNSSAASKTVLYMTHFTEHYKHKAEDREIDRKFWTQWLLNFAQCKSRSKPFTKLSHDLHICRLWNKNQDKIYQAKQFNNLTSDSLCRSCPGCFFANILITSGVLKASLIAAWIAWNNLCIHNRNICRPNKRVNPWQCLSIRQF